MRVFDKLTNQEIKNLIKKKQFRENYNNESFLQSDIGGSIIKSNITTTSDFMNANK